MVIIPSLISSQSHKRPNFDSMNLVYIIYRVAVLASHFYQKYPAVLLWVGGEVEMVNCI